MTFAQIRNYIKGLFDPILDSLKHDIDDAKVTSMSFNDFNKLPQSVKNNGKAYFIPDVNFNVNTNNVTYTQTGFTPIGTIISIMGNSAPTHYLTCDGSIYNISDYQDLANYFKEQFGSENYFGGDGIDTFAVPDMTDKFMKGSTTAGTSEDAGLPNITGALTGTNTTYQDLFDSANFANNSALYCTYDNINRQANSNVAGYYSTLKGISFSASRNNAIYGKSNTVTPKNISVLYCIAVRDIYIDAKNDYSTIEKVIGTWIDGKPLYQKTIVIQNAQANKDVYIDLYCDYFQMVIITRDQGNEYMSIPWILSQSFSMSCTKSSHQVYYRSTHSGNYIVTVQYTKTTD